MDLKDQIDVLQRVDGFMNTITDLNHLLGQVMKESQRVTDAEASSLALYDEAKQELYFEIALGEKGDQAKEIRVKLGDGVIGHVALTGKSQSISNAYTDAHFAKWVDRKTGFQTRSILAVPMFRRGRLIGVIEVLNKKSADAFDDKDKTVLEIIAHQAAIAIENARLHKEKIGQERLVSLGRGISGAAHCIKNAVNLITMGCDVVDMGLEKQDLDLIKQSWMQLKIGYERITELVMDMLTYAKPRMPEYHWVSFNPFLADLLNMVKPNLEKRQITLKSAFDPQIEKLPLDEHGMQRCIMNILSNAVDALEESGGEILVSSGLSESLKEMILKISDNGPGIEEAALCKIFDVFYSTKGSQGTGIGLPLAQKIVQEHGGRISVESGKGQGATFLIYLPLDNPNAEAKETTS